MPHRRSRRPHLDFNVIAQPVQAVHQLALGQIGKISAQHAGDLGLEETV